MSVMEHIEIGRVLRASTEGFTCGTRSQEIHQPSLGAFVQTRHADSALIVIGLITAIRIHDDPLVRQLIMASNMDESTLRDQRENRLVPVEIEVLSIGYIEDDQPRYNLPPRPPLSLDPVLLCVPDEITYFTQEPDFLRLILNAHNIAATDLIGATVRKAADARPDGLREQFLIEAGRYLAGLLSHDLVMLQHILKMIRPT
ncbi:MAG: hypothetical protein ACLFTK_16255 [Anaerolineales bacterium]